MRAAPIAVTVAPPDHDRCPPVVHELIYAHPGYGRCGHYEVSGHDAREAAGRLSWPGGEDVMYTAANERRVFFRRSSYRPQEAVADWLALTGREITVQECVEVAHAVVQSTTRERLGESYPGEERAG